MTLWVSTTPGLNEPGSDGNEGVLQIPQSSSITEGSISDCLVSYLGHTSGKFYPLAEMLSEYSIAPADWAIAVREKQDKMNIYPSLLKTANKCLYRKSWKDTYQK